MMVPLPTCDERHRRADPTEIVPIEQIGVAILAQCNHQGGRRGAGHIDEDRSGTAEIGVATVERLPVGRRPVIGGRAAKNRTRLEANDCFASTPSAAVLNVLPVVTNGFVPSLATPPGPHTPAFVTVVAQAITLAGLFICTPTSRPR